MQMLTKNAQMKVSLSFAPTLDMKLRLWINWMVQKSMGEILDSLKISYEQAIGGLFWKQI